MILRSFLALSTIGIIGAAVGETVKSIDPTTNLPLGVVAAVTVTVASGSVWVGKTFQKISDRLDMVDAAIKGLPCKDNALPCQKSGVEFTKRP